MVIIGLSGIFFGTLPDLFPEKVPDFLIGENKELDIGYNKLNKYLIEKRTSDIALKKNENGYNAIYNIASELNPDVVPPLSNLGNDRSGNFSFHKGDFEFVNPGTSLFPNQVLSFKKSTGKWQPVCEMRDLYFMKRDSHNRYYAILGFLLAFISILSEGIVSISCAIISHGKAKNPECQ